MYVYMYIYIYLYLYMHIYILYFYGMHKMAYSFFTGKEQWRGHGEYRGAIALHFCQDGSQDFLKIDYKIGGAGGSSKSLEKKRAWQSISFCPSHFYRLSHAPGSNILSI